jgi:hypothetical protein
MAKIAQAEWLIGIDPGVHTGVSYYNRKGKFLLEVFTEDILQAMIDIEMFANTKREKVVIRIEDARQRNWFGDADRRMERSGAGIREGIGSVKRDCQIWEDFCKLHGFEFEMVAPKKNKTKLDDKAFRKYTGWGGKTNEHGRDAAMLVFGF